VSDSIDALDAEMREVELHPFDLSKLSKGQYLTPEELRSRITGEPGSVKWAFALLALRDWIMRESQLHGNPLSCRIEKNGIRIHTDAEAAVYHDGRALQSQSSMLRQVRLMHSHVCQTGLTSAELSSHDRRLCLWGAKAMMLKKAAAKLKHIGTKTQEIGHAQGPTP
jgi:hypothetical protein